ncbi:EAL domain-containing protein [Marinobacter halodurans]|uniref:EAL domain-containing protein n=1 Tax=Marinobacter halodurans TaxID=2528979 RepID=A0ABY1ZQA0_9GAMM|nr:EAL domain-containing protein [Marinobacter halodurans]TBW57654.1 EAL domain-containing protein [Marinobacter halodurans]
MLSGTDILVVEDSFTQALELQAFLEEHNCHVRLAGNGIEALDEVSNAQPDVVISDIVMPKMDGYELCQSLKENAETQAIPVILVTSLIDATDVVHGLACGADNFITKPYDEKYLLTRLRYLLVNREYRAHERVQVGIEVELEGKRHFITAARQQILDLLISTYEEGVRINRELKSKHEALSQSNILIHNLLEFTSNLSAASSEKDIIDCGLKKVLAFSGVEAAWLMIPGHKSGKGGWVLAGFASHGMAQEEVALCVQGCPCHHAFGRDRIDDVVDTDRCPALAHRFEKQHHATIPLVLGADLIGLLNVVQEGGECWERQDVQAMQSIGYQFSTALGRARLHDNLESLVEKRTRELEQSESLLRNILETLPVGVYVANPDGTILLQNPEAGRIVGGQSWQLCQYLNGWSASGKPIDDRRWPLERSLETGESYLNEVVALRVADGAEKTAMVSSVPLNDTNGEKASLGAIGVIQDVSAQRKAETELRLRNQAIEASVNAIVITDANQGDHPIVYVNPAFERITGYTCEEVIGRNIRFLRRDEDQLGVESIQHAIRAGTEGHALIRNYRKDGSMFWNDWRVAPVVDSDGHVTHFVSVFNDVTESYRYQEQLEYAANFDELTGLPNRNLLMDRIQQAIAESGRQDKGFALAFVDLDNFKYINDSFGHAMGDQLLQEVARSLRDCLRPTDTLARLGGDEFVVLLKNKPDADSVSAVLARLSSAIAESKRVDGREVLVTASMGFCLYPQDGNDATNLLKHADNAMYQAKDLGRNQICSYTKEMNELVRHRVELEHALRYGIERGELELFYQPQLDAKRQLIVGVEALVRWRHDEKLISPGAFIPIAEETGLILDLDAWVVHEACRQAKAWQDQGLSPVTISVNLSAGQFRRARCVPLIRDALERSGLEARYLKVEATESMVMKNTEDALDTMRQLKSMGIELAMDDFGTGYSSLSYLKRFPFDQIKIDKSFVDNVTEDPEGAAILRSVISLADTLGMQTVAEGVETMDQFAYLTRIGCDQIQGYVYSPPIPREAFEHFLQEDRSWDTNKGFVPQTGEARTLLIVDEDVHVQNAIRRELRNEHYDLLTAADPETALKLMARQDVHVILVDQRMQQMDGITFLRKVKSIHPATVRMVLSGYTEVENLVNAINEGAVFRFITKPWEPDHLRNSLRQAFRENELVQEINALRSRLETLEGKQGPAP